MARESAENVEVAWRALMTMGHAADAIGETGLDFRTQFLNHGKDVQLDYFTRQLQLSQKLDKPAVLHIVRAHQEALGVLRANPVRGMVHAFNGGPLLAQHYLDIGLHISVGAKLLYPDNRDLHESVRQIPLERLLLESDCPDQPPPGQKVHDSATIWPLNEAVARIKKLPLERVVEQTRQNLLTLLKKEIRA